MFRKLCQVMFCCRHFYRVRIEPHCKHRSIEFLTTQTDQSEGDILIDYVLNYFFLILDNFQNAGLTLNIHISAKCQPKVKTNISKFKLAHWQFKHISFLKNPLLLCISCLIKQEYFFGLPGRKTSQTSFQNKLCF